MTTNLDPVQVFTERDPFDRGEVIRPITAAGGPALPPAEWFADPQLKGPTPLEITPEGRVYGHIAPWKVPHIGLPGHVTAPRSRSKYAYFRTGQLLTASGQAVPVGQLTLAGGHASLMANAAQAVKHYDDTKSAVADLAAGEDAHGIWVAGALRPEVTDGQVRALRASAPSGDWRPINGGLELVGICQVNVPGFPVARAMVASGEVTALVAAGASAMYRLRQERAVGVAALRRRVQRLENVATRLESLVAAAEQCSALDERKAALRGQVRESLSR